MTRTIVDVSDEQILRALLEVEDISNRAVAARLGCPYRRVEEVRKRAGLPAYVRGRRAAYATLKEAFLAQVEPVQGGHMRWTGPREKTGTPVVRWRSLLDTAYRVAFRLHHQREPVGYLTRSCEIPGCVAGAHQRDLTMREALAAGGAS
ncbi:hypothetical protein QFZ66_005827 [Streptomyces sp. B4I13]|uniref:hypothetical protein n=1 Tax=Streptomyces sp. B4I13 TaxID=3042271 RepID=UPI0027845132|nr:hypothetical protein [Streptomyces sp. B4I13]MDQ0961949.1 hypothetical protein [Streptomyces sp. B4I13]